MGRKKSSLLLGTIAGTFPKSANVFSIQIERLTGTVFHWRYARMFFIKLLIELIKKIDTNSYFYRLCKS